LSSEGAKWIDWIKLSPRYLAAIAVATSILLFSPVEVLRQIGLEVAINEYRLWIGILWLSSVSLLLAHLFAPLLSLALDRWTDRRWIKFGKRYLSSLTAEEKQILNGYIGPGVRTQKLNIQDGNVRALEQEKLIYRASNLGDLYTGFSFNIQPWVWEYLNENRGLLE